MMRFLLVLLFSFNAHAGLVVSGNAAQSLHILTATSATKTATGTNHYLSMTSNAITLTPGTWELFGAVEFGNNGSGPSYVYIAGTYTAANGADTSSAPAALSTASNLTINSVMKGNLMSEFTIASNNYTLPMPTVIVTVTANSTIYLVPYTQQTTAANTRIVTFFNARRIY